MRIYFFLLAAFLAPSVVPASRAAEKPGAVPDRSPTKIWTNDDLDRLRAQGLISIVGQELQERATTTVIISPPGPAAPTYASRLTDPDWYAERAADLRSELDQRTDALREAQEALAQVADRMTEPGVDFNENNVAITPQSGIAILQARVDQVQNQIEELDDLARQNGIPPGVLRG